MDLHGLGKVWNLGLGFLQLNLAGASVLRKARRETRDEHHHSLPNASHGLAVLKVPCLVLTRRLHPDCGPIPCPEPGVSAERRRER